MTKSHTVFLAHFPDHGFYALNQPTWEWCFTPDPTLATQYKRLANAKDRKDHADELKKYGPCNIVPCTITTSYEPGSIIDVTPKANTNAGPTQKTCKHRGCTSLTVTSTDKYCWDHLK